MLVNSSSFVLLFICGVAWHCYGYGLAVEPGVAKWPPIMAVSLRACVVVRLACCDACLVTTATEAALCFCLCAGR
jgi:hypothetical protein